MVGPAQSLPTDRKMKPETSAWLILLATFGLFCIVVAITGYNGWQFYTTATKRIENAVLYAHEAPGVIVQTGNNRDPLEPSQQIPFLETYRVKVSPDMAAYGPVASLVLQDARESQTNPTQIDIHAHPNSNTNGANLFLERYRESRWYSSHRDVYFTQESGYVRYDLAANRFAQSTQYRVRLLDGTYVMLTPGGSYSIDLPRDRAGNPKPLVVTTEPIFAEIAVRDRGRAIIQREDERITLNHDEKIQIDIDGTLGEPVAALWQLLADGEFNQYEEQVYYDDTQSETWKFAANAGTPELNLSPADRDGRFYVVQACPPQTPAHCPDNQIAVGQFRREGSQSQNFITGIEQNIEMDISEYQSIDLSAWVRITHQSLPLTGIEGSECPIMIRLLYRHRSPSDQPEQRFICIYEDPNVNALPYTSGEIAYRPVQRFEWYQLNIDLRDSALLDDAWYLEDIRIEARGHDYVSEIAKISLMATQ
ncbi:MAG: hypothetical protein GFH27_549287n339 [Chloroflexi bacterium AL-W]|nr:hypothetical protein [Chloroflexi bacterium AL-N1]NOK66613.1 hypothetical protein [Chloroflexi bacterium AL-N10]NOK72001.1 hypothetical protein [Chloroflexi bacterium AL-N5]NOK81258.1 hypothetical protein [Chloroflexi bacterium AL-W]NOK89531.1 hypothetical protein [Chloroflexi bacterium AL-N15]